MKKVLTIAGSDPSGGAGIQADVKTFSAFGVYGMAVVTAVTAQNTLGIQGIFNLPSEFVTAQLDSVLNDIPVNAAKTGMLSTVEIVHAASKAIRKFRVPNLVIDPVMISKSGTRLLQPEAIQVLKNELIPLGKVVTPNLPEAEVLSGVDICKEEDMREAAKVIYVLGCENVLITGGHWRHEALDILYDGKEFTEFKAPKISTGEVHGTGCVFSAAIAACLALEKDLKKSIETAKQFVTSAITYPLKLGKGFGLLNWFATTNFTG